MVIGCTAGLLAGCMNTTAPTPAPTPFTPAVNGTAQYSGGTYSVTQGGITRTFAAPAATGNGFLVWNGLGNEHGYLFENADVLAIAAMDTATEETIAGISGTAAASLPTSGSATYAGGFSATYYRSGATNDSWNARGAFSTDVDFATGAVTGSGTGSANSSLSITGEISGTSFNGTAQFSADEYTGAATVPLTGGFFGTNTLAGVYQGSRVTGIIYGTNP